MASTVRLSAIRIDGAGDKGLSVGEMSSVTASGGTIRRAVTGIAVKDKSVARFEDWTIEASGVGLDVFKKNWRYGRPGTAHLEGVKFLGNTLDVRISEDGEATVLPPNLLMLELKYNDKAPAIILREIEEFQLVQVTCSKYAACVERNSESLWNMGARKALVPF